jgi:hypothetical protein
MTIRAPLGTALLLCLAVGSGVFNWWTTTGQSVAADVPDSPGVDRQVDGLLALNAYLVRGASPGALTVVADFVISSGGSDRLLADSAGGGAAKKLGATARGGRSTTGVPVGSSHLLKFGPETGAQPLTVTGVTRPGNPGTFERTTFTFARRGPVSLALPVWASVSGPAGPS